MYFCVNLKHGLLTLAQHSTLELAFTELFGSFIRCLV